MEKSMIAVACLLLIPCVASQDLSLEIVLNDSITVGTEYTSLFKVRNLNSSIGKVFNITVHYAVFENESAVFSDEFRIDELNQFRTAGTGRIMMSKPGAYSLVGEIKGSSIADENPTNDLASKLIIVEEPEPIFCDIGLGILLNQTRFNQSGRMAFGFQLTNTTQPYTIEYWIEDLAGTVYKNPLNTSNLEEKSWTVSTAGQETVLVLKAQLHSGCSDGNLADNYDEKLVVVYGTAREAQQEDNVTLPAPDERSSIRINAAPTVAQVGGTISVDVTIYKGNTQKYSISAYVEKEGKKVSEITKLQVRQKYSQFNGTIPLTLKQTATNGQATIVVEGLDESDELPLVLEGAATSSANTTTAKPELAEGPLFVYEFGAVPSVIGTGDPFTVTISVKNNDDASIALDVWGYVYRGSTSYSGEREGNRKSLMLDPGDSKEIELPLVVSGAEPGPYKLKVLLNKDGQKTNKELTADIEIQEGNMGSADSQETAFQESSSQEGEEDSGAEPPSASMGYRIAGQLLCINSSQDGGKIYEANGTTRFQLPLAIAGMALLAGAVFLSSRSARQGSTNAHGKLNQ